MSNDNEHERMKERILKGNIEVGDKHFYSGLGKICNISLEVCLGVLKKYRKNIALLTFITITFITIIYIYILFKTTNQTKKGNKHRKR